MRSIVAVSLFLAVFAPSVRAQTFTAVAHASIHDSPRDGIGDSFNAAPFEGLLRQTSSVEDRAIQEFNCTLLTGATIISATLAGQVSVNNAADNGVRTFDFALYAGDGFADLTDFQIPATVIGSGQYHPPMQSSFNFSFDVTNALQTLISSGSTFVGLKVDCTSEPNFPSILGFPNTTLVVVAGSCGGVTTYCTSGTTSSGCVPTIGASGTPSASNTTGFTLFANNVEGQKQGLFFYGVDNSGFTPLPWGTSSAFFCVKPPTQRLPTTSTGGTSGACDGSLSIDWNSFIASNPGALGVPFSGGSHVYAQAWFRDPPSPKTTMFTNALEFVVCP